jgi:hypothetical protein
MNPTALIATVVAVVAATAYNTDALFHRKEKEYRPAAVTLAPEMGPKAFFNLLSKNGRCLVTKRGSRLRRTRILKVTRHCSPDQAAVDGTTLTFYRKRVEEDPSGTEFHVAQRWQGTEKCLYKSWNGRLRMDDCNGRSLRFREVVRKPKRSGRGGRHVLQTAEIKHPKCLTVHRTYVRLQRCRNHWFRRSNQLDMVLA